jgi:hypothetical protein
MARTDQDWNFDRMQSAMAQMDTVKNDVMRTLHKGKVNSFVKERMCASLRNAFADLNKIKIDNRD